METYRDGEIAETVHCMNKTDKAFRLIVLQRPREQNLFEDKSLYRYHAIASNRPNEDAAVTMEWYSQRGDASENRRPAAPARSRVASGATPPAVARQRDQIPTISALRKPPQNRAPSEILRSAKGKEFRPDS